MQHLFFSLKQSEEKVLVRRHFLLIQISSCCRAGDHLWSVYPPTMFCRWKMETPGTPPYRQSLLIAAAQNACYETDLSRCYFNPVKTRHRRNLIFLGVKVFFYNPLIKSTRKMSMFLFFMCFVLIERDNNNIDMGVLEKFPYLATISKLIHTLWTVQTYFKELIINILYYLVI